MTLTRAAEGALPLSLTERICLNDEQIERILARLEAQAQTICRLEERLRVLEGERQTDKLSGGGAGQRCGI